MPYEPEQDSYSLRDIKYLFNRLVEERSVKELQQASEDDNGEEEPHMI